VSHRTSEPMYCIAGVRATEAETAMNDRNDVEAASRAFIASAFGMLKSEYVIRSKSRPKGELG
jgi:hypothetical protein